MVAHVDEAALHVVVLELLGSVVLGLAGGGAVDDDIADRLCRHVDAGLHLSEEFVLGGDYVTNDGAREGFLDHILEIHDETKNRLSIALRIVISVVKISWLVGFLMGLFFIND